MVERAGNPMAPRDRRCAVREASRRAAGQMIVEAFEKRMRHRGIIFQPARRGKPQAV
jgi:hypothetical protein